jgi:hypothetical protein
MPSITNILLNTPLWVFGLLAALTWLGVQALQDRTLPIWRVLATPAIFIAWGIASLVERSLSSPILLADWLIAVAVAAGIAATMSRLDNIRIDRARQLVSLRGSPFPIIRNLLIFAVKYGLGVALVLAPAFRPSFLSLTRPCRGRPPAISSAGWRGSPRSIGPRPTRSPLLRNREQVAAMPSSGRQSSSTRELPPED